MNQANEVMADPATAGPIGQDENGAIAGGQLTEPEENRDRAPIAEAIESDGDFTSRKNSTNSSGNERTRQEREERAVEGGGEGQAPQQSEPYIDETDWERCRKCAQKLGRSDGANRRLRYELLAETYQYCRLWVRNTEECKRICTARGIPCTEATRKNPYSVVIRAFSKDGGISAKSASIYGTALRYAALESIAPDAIADFLAKQGGIDECAKKFRTANRKEGTKEKKRATAFRVDDVPWLPDGPVEIVVRVVDGRGSFVRFADGPRDPMTTTIPTTEPDSLPVKQELPPPSPAAEEGGRPLAG